MKPNERLLIPAVAVHFILLSTFFIKIFAIPIPSNDSSVENVRLITELLSRNTDDLSISNLNDSRGFIESNSSVVRKTLNRTIDSRSNDSNQSFDSHSLYQMNVEQMEQIESEDESFSAPVAFDIGRRSSRGYAFVTSNSYKRYLKYLENLCRELEYSDIVEMDLIDFDDNYFRWEEIEFGRAVIKQIFPETENGDYDRYHQATRALQQMHLRSDFSSECKPSTTEDTWSERANERSQFEDFIINTIFRPHFDGSYAQQVLKEEAEVIERMQRGENGEYLEDGVVTNTLDNLDRRKRQSFVLSRQAAEKRARREANLYRAKHKNC